MNGHALLVGITAYGLTPEDEIEIAQENVVREAQRATRREAKRKRDLRRKSEADWNEMLVRHRERGA